MAQLWRVSPHARYDTGTELTYEAAATLVIQLGRRRLQATIVCRQVRPHACSACSSVRSIRRSRRRNRYRRDRIKASTGKPVAALVSSVRLSVRPFVRR